MKTKGIKKRSQNKLKYGRFYEEGKTDSNKRIYTLKRVDSLSGKTGTNEFYRKQSSKNIALKMNEIINDYPENYYKHHLKKDLIKIIINVFASLLHIIIIISYISSLNACSDNLSLNECIKKLDINYYYKVYLLCFVSGLLISLILVFIIARFVSIFQLPFIIIELIVFICMNHNDNVFKNGLFSFKLLLSFIGISFLLLYLFIFFLVTLGQKQYFYSCLFFFFLFSFYYNSIIIFI